MIGHGHSHNSLAEPLMAGGGAPPPPAEDHRRKDKRKLLVGVAMCATFMLTEIVGGLRASPIWDAGAFDWLRPFEEHAAEIRAELLALKEQRGFQPLKLPNWASKHQKKAADGAGAVSHDAGDWNVFYLFLHEEEYEENCRRCPLTTSLLQAPRDSRARNSRARNSRNSVQRTTVL